MLEVKIKPDKYGQAIALLLRLGEGLQTRHRRIMIVTSQQKQFLQQAGFVASNGSHVEKPNQIPWRWRGHCRT